MNWNPENVTMREEVPVRYTYLTGVKVRYLGPTDTKGSRVKASWLDGHGTPVTLSMDYSCNVGEMEDRAAKVLVQRALDELEATTGPAPGRRWQLVRVGGSDNGDVYYAVESY